MSLPPLAPPLQESESSTELNLMITSQPYDPFDTYLLRLRHRGIDLVDRFNKILNTNDRMKMCQDIWVMGNDVRVMPGFIFEYGFNINFGESIYVGPRCTFIDVGKITIGSRTQIGANVQLYTPTHPLSPEERTPDYYFPQNDKENKESFRPEGSKPIVIGPDCWIGGGAIILPGVTIGAGCTVGAGAVVTKDVEPRCVVVGSPAKVIKRIKDDGSVMKS
ncbi:hypothetical protein TREMEDRAFT_70264 [Tremella mesenterica DSM 1558]|uniref:uncharacterized protein n=1 Tax=Tremella mesenterica (strain ATCC 24925 / CBS 8224 / DSM 1558 / NBRC 9311 / NRRL Y-6157 / RJB 2259-6 / UBC 559-6) TaxID=578456 RepID=UPI00032C40EC|nr:uncharacterized protein TREMEDRAFT_70264 [Tremella mesenterica DSM 1558]EIW66149.1 hypothetical protein TREMEDRAFT_70264 [Tremella mesenterica DSM 1558]